MNELDRRRFLRNATAAFAAAELATIGSADAQSGQTTLAPAPRIRPGTSTSFGSLKRVNAGVLSIAYAEAGPADGPPVLLLHGWPYDIHSFVDVAPILANAGYRVLVPYSRGYGETRFLSSDTPRNAQPAAVATDAINFLDALGIQKVVVAGFDWGGRTANLMAFLWPERCKALVSVSGYLVGSQAAWANPLQPSAELPWWYLFYFSTERGKAGYAKYNKDFNRLIWQLASPRWAFDGATFERTAKAFENLDFVHISLHNYRWYMGLEHGESKYDELEARIATFPTISLPTITLEGDANGAPHGDPSAYARKYTGTYEHRNIVGGIGHNLPQEAPEAFAQGSLRTLALWIAGPSQKLRYCAIAWLNSDPLSNKSLRGKVVLDNFWTYSCVNSLRPLPYVKSRTAKYKDAGLVVIGVHTPEFSFEKERANVEQALRDLKLTYPVFRFGPTRD